MIEFSNVTVTYPSGVTALDDVSLRIGDGDFTFVVGKSGAGKSTLIRLLINEIAPTSGRVDVNGYVIGKLKKRDICSLRREVGYVFQDYKLIETMNVYENIAFVLRCIDAPMRFLRERVPYVLSLVELRDKRKAMPRELSGGERQRVAIARALVNNPRLIIADEPTGNLDPATSVEIIELLHTINSECGTNVIMVTHEHEFVRQYRGNVISLEEGKVRFSGSLQ
jgi:cell division transport system ATP-binding protein